MSTYILQNLAPDTRHTIWPPFLTIYRTSTDMQTQRCASTVAETS